jgi:FKBP-type peptidyl-prolyl cis-trans isomerase
VKKLTYLLPLVVLVTFVFNACGNDDEDNGTTFVEARDRAIEKVDSTLEVEEYLETHFYNYEEFAAPAADFDFKIKFDTIAGENSDKIALINQVESKMVQDRINETVQYKLYFLKALVGEGESPDFPDIVRINYEGTYVSNEESQEGIVLFDSSVSPIQFDLTQIVNGLQDALTEFKAGTGFITNPDGTVAYENFSVGAVFMQSGLGYYVSPPAGSAVTIPLYSQLIFSFQLFEREIGDQDMDGIPSVMEDLNNNGLEEDDNTDGDALLNFLDADDDNDGRPTEDEIIINEDGSITFPDEDNDGVVDYLDMDS